VIETKICSKCENELQVSEFYADKRRKNDGLRGACKECHIKRVVKYQKTEPAREMRRKSVNKYQENNPLKKRAKEDFAGAVGRGEIDRPSVCESCGSKENIDAHHDDYSKSLDIRGLCRKCHSLWHRINGAGLNGDLNKGDK